VFGFGTNHEEQDFISMQRQKPSSLHNSMLYREQNLMKYFFFHTKRSSFHGPEEDSLKKTLHYAC